LYPAVGNVIRTKEAVIGYRGWDKHLG